MSTPVSTLELSLEQDGQFILDAVPEFTDATLHMQSPLLFRAEKRIHKRNSLVFEGKLHVGPSVPISVVCKTAFAESDPDRLNDEAAFYMTRLKALQGSTVPKFYGLFAGMYITAGGRKRRMACILLESWGLP